MIILKKLTFLLALLRLAYIHIWFTIAEDYLKRGKRIKVPNYAFKYARNIATATASQMSFFGITQNDNNIEVKGSKAFIDSWNSTYECPSNRVEKQFILNICSSSRAIIKNNS